jgi:predicted metal-dependent HD superfamily phosphohydrolase
MNASGLDRLRNRWEQMVSRFGIPEGRTGPALDELVKAYNDPGRYYHNLDHIEVVLANIDLLSDAARDLPVVQLAGWYHDAVYDPRAGDNEEQSAVLVETTCAGWGLHADIGKAAGRLIRATRTHEAGEEEVDALLLLDADLAILGAEQTEYDSYAAAIRREYAWVKEEEYRRGRTRVLKSFLRRQRIFKLDRMHRERELQARGNLAREITFLSS